MARRTTAPISALTLLDDKPSALELHALAQVAKAAKKVRGRLKVADGQLVDFKCQITGAVNVGGDQTSPTKAKPDAEVLLAHVLDSLGVATRKKAIAAARKNYQAEASDEAVEAAQDLIAGLTTESMQPKRGNVTGAVSVRILDRTPPTAKAKAA